MAREKSVYLAVIGVLLCACGAAKADLLTNGNLDRSQAVEIVPGFFLPKPANWQNVGTRTISGPYEEEMSSEPWAGPAPTPVTTDGNLDPPHPNGVGGPDGGVFFKPFTGGSTNGPATGHLYQDVPATPGLTYTLTGWAGAEANALMADAVFAVEFFDSLGSEISLSGSELSLLPTLYVENGQPFDYKQYTLSATAPAGTVSVRARASMIDAISNPSGGGQAFVVDDFTLTVPEPSTTAAAVMGALGLLSVRRRSVRRGDR
jgi:hypothetical protein